MYKPSNMVNGPENQLYLSGQRNVGYMGDGWPGYTQL